MSDATEEISIDELTGNTGAPPEPGHDAWFRKQVQETLARDKAGKLKYRDLDEVAAEFGFDAR